MVELKKKKSRTVGKSGERSVSRKSVPKHEWYDDEPAPMTHHLVPANKDSSAARASISPHPPSPSPEFHATPEQEALRYSEVEQERSIPPRSRWVPAALCKTTHRNYPTADDTQKLRIEALLRWHGRRGEIFMFQMKLYSQKFSPHPTEKGLKRKGKGKARDAGLDPRLSPADDGDDDEDEQALR